MKRLVVKLRPIVRCADCDCCLSIVPTGHYAKCFKTNRQMTAQEYMNEGFPKDCPLDTLPTESENNSFREGHK